MNKKVFIGSALISLLCHLFTCLFFHLSVLSVPQERSENKNQILKETFSQIERREVMLGSKTHTPSVENIEPITSEQTLTFPKYENEPLSFSHTFKALEEMISTKIALPVLAPVTEPFNFLDHLPKDLAVARSEDAHQIANALSLEMGDFSTEKAIPVIAKAPLLQLPTLNELNTSSYSQEFDIDISFIPKEEGEGYIFAITLIPKPDLDLLRLPQHFTFLLDRSNSIQQERLNCTKVAITKALEELDPEDAFNIVVFDNKMEKFAPQFLSADKETIDRAIAFVNKIQLGSFFSSSDLYRPLFLTVPGYTTHGELHTAILFTDGENFGKKQAQKAILADWTQYNGGKVALFALGINNDAHAATLDAATVFNRGRLFQATTYRGIRRKTLKLMKTIQTPIAKNITCNAIALQPNSSIDLLAKSVQMPHLYKNEPYVILGETDTLADFVLFVQGNLKSRWLNIKKTISFAGAKKGTWALKKEWAIHKAYDLYEQYVIDNDAKHLADAAALLQPFDFEVAFQ